MDAQPNLQRGKVKLNAVGGLEFHLATVSTVPAHPLAGVNLMPVKSEKTSRTASYKLFARHFGGHRCAARMELLDGSDNLVGCDLQSFEQTTGNTDWQGVKGPVAVAKQFHQCKRKAHSVEVSR